VRSKFIFTDAPFASAHASTIAETADGLVAAWFGGPFEGHPEVSVWLAREREGHWSAPVEVARGEDGRGHRQPCWNPVLFQPRAGPLLLFYKAGPSPRRWWGMLQTSADGGRSWTVPMRLPRGILGPIKNKPIEFADGSLLCPSSTERFGWRAHLERTPDLGLTWRKGRALNPPTMGAIQPCILTWPDGRMQLLCRSRRRAIATCWSLDGGRRWSRMQLTDLPNPDSGIDAVSLRDGRALLVYNHATSGRSPLNLALSENGTTWRPSCVLEGAQGGEYSYPAIIEGRDGRIQVSYTWNRRRIRHVSLDVNEL
jgi:predicted neuraminidase